MVPEVNAHAFPSEVEDGIEVMMGFGTLWLAECLSRLSELENMAVGIGFPHF